MRAVRHHPTKETAGSDPFGQGSRVGLKTLTLARVLVLIMRTGGVDMARQYHVYDVSRRIERKMHACMASRPVVTRNMRLELKGLGDGG